MVDYPVCTFIEECTGRMNIDQLVVNKSAITFSGVLFGCMSKEASCDGLATLPVLFVATDDRIPVSIHESQQLFADVLGSTHSPELDEVLMTPDITEVIMSPLLIHCQ